MPEGPSIDMLRLAGLRYAWGWRLPALYLWMLWHAVTAPM